MQTKNHVYISLGSNVGDKINFLQQAVDAIFEKIGDIVRISSVYQTPSWGFESEDFYNACIEIATFYSAQEVLDLLLTVEKQLGRTRAQGKGYQARTIDLDILLSSEGVIATDTLRVPHPAMQDRMFVLRPLLDIAPDVIHDTLQLKISDLINRTKDEVTPEIVRTDLVNPEAKYPISAFQYLTLEGNIGAGKTSLAHMIANEFNGKLVLEQFADNPFLPKFYEDMDRYAFPLEMSFLADRYQRLQDDIGQFDLFTDFVVSDYDVFKSLIFAKITLQQEEFKLYKKVFDLMYSKLPKPGLYVYLYQSTERLLQNIKKRGRDYEQKISEDYLEKINKGYLQFIKSQTEFKTKIIDVSDLDFIKNRSDYITILQTLVAQQ
ncbi:2-amino-4-hydroxy-6-hydroxymethyldihydropteridine diphosphokinase [Aquimarina brevivitae]|uniref:2-amino-4-hydroxy-6-hydroxymethyldihydropteridine pyrophosphokinase n=1 Tax=Aquimarina brevivitae TaxID=323412 RepID=A0A4Q7NYB3_9FLAO|nr:2-amino-4-hydroxy-6-hydroxymethyldihydropteridine diphosphokinase [Aquimarina brevivitae]RZS92305.1 2-amino-4-hydroxy-6-hydroxymethyldihydropteridine diphosphokinase [Aquimarina brevivitae]